MNIDNSLNYKKHQVSHEIKANGNIYLHSQHSLNSVVNKTGDWLDFWAKEKPQDIFIAQRENEGWQKLSYAQTLTKVDKIVQSLAKLGLEVGDKIMIIAPNSINHALLSIAGQKMGSPIVPVAVQYAMLEAAKERLEYVLNLIQPKLIYLPQFIPHTVKLITQLLPQSLIALDESENENLLSFSSLLLGDESIDIERLYRQVNANTVGKILLTSGSTSNPKGVLTTHKMMCTNQSQIASVLPFIQDKPPIILDWLPWNHVFGGNHNFNLILANGGTLYIDDGKPTPEFFERTIENQLMIEGTIAFNVPVGFAMLFQHFLTNQTLAEKFFTKLDMIVYAGASLPQSVWWGLEDMAKKYASKIPLITSSWGLTETAPACLYQHQFADKSGVVGVPLPEISVKLMPDENNQDRYEIRVKGNSITKGYYKDTEKTKESFDNEGYFITGDAVKLVNSNDFNQGLLFDGRMGENFKLQTGTWVDAPNLRLVMLDKLTPYATDIIITGENRNEVGMLIVPNLKMIEKEDLKLENLGKTLYSEKLTNIITHKIKEYNNQVKGSSKQVKRALILANPPSFAMGEITAKGNINFKKFLSNHSDLLESLYQTKDKSIILTN